MGRKSGVAKIYIDNLYTVSYSYIHPNFLSERNWSSLIDSATTSQAFHGRLLLFMHEWVVCSQVESHVGHFHGQLFTSGSGGGRLFTNGSFVVTSGHFDGQ